MTCIIPRTKGTKEIVHMLDFQEYGVTKKWVIIREISKETENCSRSFTCIVGRYNMS